MRDFGICLLTLTLTLLFCLAVAVPVRQQPGRMTGGPCRKCETFMCCLLKTSRHHSSSLYAHFWQLFLIAVPISRQLFKESKNLNLLMIPLHQMRLVFLAYLYTVPGLLDFVLFCFKHMNLRDCFVNKESI